MTKLGFTFCNQSLEALASGALFWPERSLLVVSDLHFGKSMRLARTGGAPLPPYETIETLNRLEHDIETTAATRIVCLGDSFDAPGMDATLPEAEQLWIARLQAGRDWIWIEGNHDPGPVTLGGSHLRVLDEGALQFRHIASEDPQGEVSGHYHPKARLSVRGRMISRPCFVMDEHRLILPAYGTYTGGLCTTDTAFADLLSASSMAILTGSTPRLIPMPRHKPSG